MLRLIKLLSTPLGTTRSFRLALLATSSGKLDRTSRLVLRGTMATLCSPTVRITLLWCQQQQLWRRVVDSSNSYACTLWPKSKSMRIIHPKYQRQSFYFVYIQQWLDIKGEDRWERLEKLSIAEQIASCTLQSFRSVLSYQRTRTRGGINSDIRVRKVN